MAICTHMQKYIVGGGGDWMSALSDGFDDLLFFCPRSALMFLVSSGTVTHGTRGNSHLYE